MAYCNIDEDVANNRQWWNDIVQSDDDQTRFMSNIDNQFNFDPHSEQIRKTSLQRVPSTSDLMDGKTANIFCPASICSRFR